MSDEEGEYYFCWKVRGGDWIVKGPYKTYDEASKARQASKAADAEYGNVFGPTSHEDAKARCDSGRTG